MHRNVMQTHVLACQAEPPVSTGTTIKTDQVIYLHYQSAVFILYNYLRPPGLCVTLQVTVFLFCFNATVVVVAVAVVVCIKCNAHDFNGGIPSE